MPKPRVHMKGYILQLLAEHGQLWDYEVAEKTLAAYGLSGRYWYGTIRLTLTDLYSGGLLDEVGSTVDPSKSFGEEKILMRMQLNSFGRERMQQTGLMEAAR